MRRAFGRDFVCVPSSSKMCQNRKAKRGRTAYRPPSGHKGNGSQAERAEQEEIAATTEASEISPTGYGPLLVLAFLIIDALPLEALWRQWLEQYNRFEGSGEKVNIRVIVHAKYPERVRSPWVRRHLLAYSHRPEWGSVQIAQAMWDLVAEAAACETFGDRSSVVFLSESCFPIAPVEKCALRLGLSSEGRARTALAAYRKPCNGYAAQYQFSPLRSDGSEEGPLPRSCVWKADQWIAVGGHDAHNILRMPQSLGACPWRLVGRQPVKASDELLFPVCLALVGALGHEHGKQDAPPIPQAGTLCGNKAYEDLLDSDDAEVPCDEAAAEDRALRMRITYALWKVQSLQRVLRRLMLNAFARLRRICYRAAGVASLRGNYS